MANLIQHTCNNGRGPFFGRLDPGCPRCDQLIADKLWATTPAPAEVPEQRNTDRSAPPATTRRTSGVGRLRVWLCDLIGAGVALIGAALACCGVIALAVAGWHLFSGGGLLRPAGAGIVALVFSLVLRFAADLDRYEYIPAPPTRRRAPPRRRAR